MEDIFIGNGVSELIVMTMQSTFGTTDEVLIPLPDYPYGLQQLYLPAVSRDIICATKESNWLPDLDDIRSLKNNIKNTRHSYY